MSESVDHLFSEEERRLLLCWRILPQQIKKSFLQALADACYAYSRATKKT